MQEKRPQLGLRLDASSMRRLEELSAEAGIPATSCAREMLQHALAAQNSGKEPALAASTLASLTAVQRQLAAALPMLTTLHARVIRLEELICMADRNAAHRRATDHLITWKQWSRIVRELLTMREGLFATFETVRAQQGDGRELCVAYYAELTAGAEAIFKPYRTRLQDDCSALENEVPPVLQHKPASGEEQRTIDRLLASLAAMSTRLGAEPALDPEPTAIDQPELFDDAGEGLAPAPDHAHGTGALPVTGSNGAVS